MRAIVAVLILSCSLWAAPTIQTVTTGAELTTAIGVAAAANTGPQVIVLTAGNNFDTATGFTLPARSGSYTGWITLRSSRVGELNGKTRVAPADVAKMATLRVNPTQVNDFIPVIYTNGHPSSYWRLEGLEFTVYTTGKQHAGWLIGIGYGTDEAETEPSKVSHHFVIDRCYIHGIAFDNGPKDGIRVNGDNIEVLNSYISEIKRDDAESHGILGYSFSGPLLVRNTFVGGAAIGSMIGGAGSVNVSIQPNNVQFLGNHYQGTPTHRALRYADNPQGTVVPSVCSVMDPGAYYITNQTFWKTDTSEFYVCNGAAASANWHKIATGITGNVCMDGDFWNNTTAVTYFTCSGGQWVSAGSDRTITGGSVSPFTRFWSKNRFELKKVTGALVEGNLIENCFSPTIQQQRCSAILLNWVTNQDGPWATLRSVSIQNNLIRRTAQMYNEGIESSSRIGSFLHRYPYDVAVDNNLVQDGNNAGILTAINQLSYYNVPPITIGIGGVGINTYGHSRFTHNTLINPLASTIFWPNGFINSEAATVGRSVSDNIFEVGWTSKAASWNGGGGCASFDTQWTSRSLKNNIAVQLGQELNAALTPDWYDTADCRSWAFPWKRSTAGVSNPVYSASITGGVLTIRFGTGPDDYWLGHGLLQGTKVKLAGWTATTGTINGTYTLPRLWCSSDSVLTKQYYQPTLCLPTAATGPVTVLGTVEATVDYTDYAAQNFRLASTSAYKGWATDSSDPGVNQDTVEWATATASSGLDNPYLDFRVRAITPTATGAVVRFTAYSDAACTWLTSSTRAFGDTLGAWGSGTRIGRDGVITASGLSSNTGYWYRVTCDGTTRDGQFVTTH